MESPLNLLVFLVYLGFCLKFLFDLFLNQHLKKWFVPNESCYLKSIITYSHQKFLSFVNTGYHYFRLRYLYSTMNYVDTIF